MGSRYIAPMSSVTFASLRATMLQFELDLRRQPRARLDDRLVVLAVVRREHARADRELVLNLARATDELFGASGALGCRGRLALENVARLLGLWSLDGWQHVLRFVWRVGRRCGWVVALG